jgi:hypothetical protein
LYTLSTDSLLNFSSLFINSLFSIMIYTYISVLMHVSSIVYHVSRSISIYVSRCIIHNMVIRGV